LPEKGLGEWRPPLVDVTEKELATASAVWQAYRATTPEACFGQLAKDLSALPLLRPVLLELLDELPSATTGLGATEMRMLELIGRGTRSRMNFSYSRASVRPASSISGSADIYWMGSRSARSQRSPALTMHCARLAKKFA
jgi:hypothetical protein